MATITHYITYEEEMADNRALAENFVRDKVKLKTSDRVTWSQLRNMRPVPRWGEAHQRETGFYCDFVKPNHKSRLVWELEIDYTPIKGGQVDPDPNARPPVITFVSSLIEQPTLFDKDGKPIMNAAGQFVTGVIERISIFDYTIEKNFPTDPGWLQSHLGAVNQDPVKLRGLIWAPKTLLFSAVSGGEYTTENRATFAPFRLTIMADPRKWIQEVWNQGTVELVQKMMVVRGASIPTNVWTQKPILRGDPPEPVEEPWPLDERGRALQDHLQQNKNEPIKAGKLIKLNFETQKVLAFSALPLK